MVSTFLRFGHSAVNKIFSRLDINYNDFYSSINMNDHIFITQEAFKYFILKSFFKFNFVYFCCLIKVMPRMDLNQS